MLLQLIINNFVLIDKLDIRFYQGLNILTGETGAGKSIIINAVNMALGERADKNLVRADAEKATIQMVFSTQNLNLIEQLREQGIELIDNDVLIIVREIFSNGRSLCRINDRMVTASLLKDISKYLIDIHGQHSHQSLLYPENHIEILDSFNEVKIDDLKKAVKNNYTELKNLKKKVNSLHGDENERERIKDLLKFQIDEINNANLKLGEDEKLLSEYNLLSNMEKISNVMMQSYEQLYNGDNTTMSIIDSVSHISNKLDSIKELDSPILNMYNTLQDCLFTIEDVARDIRDYNERIEFSPSRLKEIENRIDMIDNLKRKYGKTIEEVTSYGDKICIQLEEINNSETIICELKENIDKKSKELLDLSLELSKIRKSIAVELEQKMENELNSLNMNNTNFKVYFTENIHDESYDFTENGIDKVEFLVSTNKGEVPKPVAKTASGGELSRIMLAFKTIFADADNALTLIFDEIDTGISGRTADIVGEKLAVISRNHQILCITHLSQIAKMADHHFYIEKVLQDDKTITNIKELVIEEKIVELGRLLGGNSLTQLTLEHSKEMISIGNKFKRSLK
ncbi:DNA repair protein RecN [Lutibacter sp. B2]|nr:DNA repair protein RecN [Lutibacter sp. B2]